MTEGLFIAAITSPLKVENEASRISSILENGEADIVHIRKPGWTLHETADLICDIPSIWHGKIKLHDHFELLERFQLAGIHLNNRNPEPHPLAKSISKSCHEIEQLQESEHYDYVTLSPIFDSISKPGYGKAFALEEIKDSIVGHKVVALGGVSPEKFSVLKDAGFFGAAMLGYFWK